MLDALGLPLLLGCLAPLVFGCAVVHTSRAPGDDPESEGENAAYLALRVAVVTLIVCALVALTLVFCAGVPILVGLVAVAASLCRRRRAGQSVLLWAIAGAIDRNMPLVPVVEAFAAEHRGRMRRQAMLLAERLKAGWALSDAVDASPGLFPADARLAIRLGSESGALPRALRDLVDGRESQETLWVQVAGRFFYLGWVILFAWLIATFLMWKIAPQFEKIFEDFGAELPALTQMTLGISAAFVTFWPVLVLLLAGLFFILIYSVLRYIGWAEWDLPGVTRLMRRLHAAAILDALALAAERARPFSEALALLAASYPKRRIRDRLRRAVRDVESGADWAASLARHGLIGRADLAVLEAAARLGNLPWAMREMADSSRRRLAYRMQTWIHVLFALLILSLGAMVLVFVVSFFLPLISLIQKLT